MSDRAERERRIVLADRQTGAMPTEIRNRPDGDLLWAAFRRTHYLSWTGRDIQEFARGWDAKLAHVLAMPHDHGGPHE
jgi:hypothetical protein